MTEQQPELTMALSSDTPEESPAPEAGEIEQQIRVKAMDLLAMREHSRLELHRKLYRRYGEVGADRLDPVLDRLTQQGLLSDERFAEAYINMRARKGYGPMRIAQELQERGVESGLAESLLGQRNDWQATLEQAWRKKFGQRPASYEDRVRQMRFLNYRGFASEDIQQFLN